MLGHEEIRTMISSFGTGIGTDEFDIENCRYGKIILMTDADVDGAHIRTLLLTFLFRQMPDLLDKRMVFIAQPPLYEVRHKGKKKSEYVLTEHEMRRRMIARGLEDTSLVIRDMGKSAAASKKGTPKPRTGEITGAELTDLIKSLADIERLSTVLTHRGIALTHFIEEYYDGQRLPAFLIRRDGKEEPFYDAQDYTKRVDEIRDELKGDKASELNGNGEEPAFIAEELHEVTRINQISQKLKNDFGLDLTDFMLKPEKEESGEAKPTKFQVNHAADAYEIASLGDVCPAIRTIGGKGVDIKRFKGLGEMNAEQLWETTMNPETRTLLSVRLDDAGEADRLFSILMGDDVEKRRRFIQDHALEVQNLDV
jgi:DNA gyrase subunit B